MWSLLISCIDFVAHLDITITIAGLEIIPTIITTVIRGWTIGITVTIMVSVAATSETRAISTNETKTKETTNKRIQQQVFHKRSNKPLSNLNRPEHRHLLSQLAEVSSINYYAKFASIRFDISLQFINVFTFIFFYLFEQISKSQRTSAP